MSDAQNASSLNANWRDWLQTNLARGCSHKTILEAMLNGGLDALDAARALVYTIDPQQQISNNAPATSAQVFLNSRLARSNIIDVDDAQIKLVARLKRPDLAVFDDVLSATECDELIALSRHKLERSTAIDKQTGKADVIAERTSEGTFFYRGENALVQKIETRLAKLMNWPLENGEGLQILHYPIGGEYRPHFDFFPPVDPGSAVHLAEGGQRVATLVMYLNDVDDGGGTDFPDVGLTVVPRKGRAVYFAYTGPFGEVDPLSLHAGMPVLAGDKWIATKWLRQRPYGS